MARARNIKPGFFSNDDLVELPFEGRLLFIGLWTIADREGRLLDRPKKIKMDLFPADVVNVDSLLDQLAARGFIVRYEVGDLRCIQVQNFSKHQNPHKKEANSTLPDQYGNMPSNVPAPCEHRSSTGLSSEIPERAGLIPDSGFLIPDTGYLIADSGLLNPDPLQEQPPAPAVAAAPKKAAKKDEPNPLNLETWLAYKHAYAARYGVPPIQNAKSNSLVKQIVMALGAEAPAVAGFFVQHNGRNYVAAMHQLGLLQLDHAKLRTEWATNQQMTSTKALQADKTATNLDSFAPLIAAAKAREEAERNQNA